MVLKCVFSICIAHLEFWKRNYSRFLVLKSTFGKKGFHQRIEIAYKRMIRYTKTTFPLLRYKTANIIIYLRNLSYTMAYFLATLWIFLQLKLFMLISRMSPKTESFSIDLKIQIAKIREINSDHLNMIFYQSCVYTVST